MQLTRHLLTSVLEAVLPKVNGRRCYLYTCMQHFQESNKALTDQSLDTQEQFLLKNYYENYYKGGKNQYEVLFAVN